MSPARTPSDRDVVGVVGTGSAAPTLASTVTVPSGATLRTRIPERASVRGNLVSASENTLPIVDVSAKDDITCTDNRCASLFKPEGDTGPEGAPQNLDACLSRCSDDQACVTKCNDQFRPAEPPK